MSLRFVFTVIAFAHLGSSIGAQQAKGFSDSTFLTIYNGNFAVARTTIELNLQPGLNNVSTGRVTAQLEPDSVFLRSLEAPTATFRIVEQSYGSGVAQSEDGFSDAVQAAPAQVKPTLRWQIQSDKVQDLHAELAYITGGLSWQATYNAIMPDIKDVTGDLRADLLGWVTLSNQSGADFPGAHIKLMAGDDGKTSNEGFKAPQMSGVPHRMRTAGFAASGEPEEVQIGQNALDNLHVYDLNQTISLGDGEVKQVQYFASLRV